MPLGPSNPFSITFAGTAVGGSTDYQLLGPYVIEKSYDDFRLVFELLITGTSYANLQALADTVETTFRKRLTHGETLVISLSGSTWTYTVGTNILKVVSQVTKAGNSETDQGFSRAYTISITGQLPADATAGLRDLEVLVDYAATRQRTVTMRGVYTANSGTNAMTLYRNNFDTEATAYLTAIAAGGQVTWELVDENFTIDREKNNTTPNPHICTFTRQYIELIFEQVGATLDDPAIRDHRVTFTNLSQYPADSKANIKRLQRVVASYDCAVDITQSKDLPAIYRSKVRDHLRQTFQTNFNPVVFAMEEERVSFDETSNRISVSTQFVFQPSGAEALVEVAQSVAFREARTIDYTPVHQNDELAYEADLGWATLERVWNRTAIVIGTESPKLRITERPRFGDAGPIDSMGGQTSVDQRSGTGVTEGWNVVSSTSQVTPQWIGNPSDGNTQIQMAVLTENVVERYHRRPSGGPTTTRAYIPIQGPTTGSR